MPELPLPGRGDVRPGAMTTAMRAVSASGSQDPWVRAGVVRRGAIAEERWVAPGTSLTWGRSERADVVVTGAPAVEAPLVTWRDGQFELALSGVVAGRLVMGEATLDLAEQARAGARAISLSRSARARIELGDTTVLLELAPRPPKPRRAPPPIALGPLFGTDGRFTAVALGSIVLHAIFVVGLSEHDWPAVSDPRMARLGDVIFIAPELPPLDDHVDDFEEHALVDDDGGETAPDPAEVPRETPSLAQTRPTPSAPRAPSLSASQLESLSAEVARDLEQHLQLGALGDDGALAQLLRNGAVRSSEAELMAAVRGESEAALAPRAGSMPAMRNGQSLAALAGSDHGSTLEVHRTGAVDEGGGRDERRISVPRPQQIEIDDPGVGFDPRALARAIRGRMGAVRACYERALRDDPQLAGRLELELRVERVGTLSGVRARSGSIGDDTLHDCVAGAVRSVRLPTGPDEPTTVSFPLVFAPQQ